MSKFCCFTGHRDVASEDLEEVRDKLNKIIPWLLERDVTEFRCGGAVGFDMLAADAIIEAKKIYPEIKLILYIPCKEQDKYYDFSQKRKYKHQLKCSDEIRLVSEKYYRGCMLDRNKMMLKDCSYCMSYQRKATGGTAYTVNCAKQSGIRVIAL